MKAMKNYLILILWFISIGAESQLAIIDYKYNYMNVRQDSNSSSIIVGRLYNEDVFLYDAFSFTNKVKKEWNLIFQNISLDKIEPFKSDFYIKELHKTKNDFICYGYIRKNVLLPIEDLEKINIQYIPPMNDWWSLKDDSLCAINDTISLVIKTGKFNKDEHKIDSVNSRYVEKIDGKNPYGIDGDVPRLEIKNIELKINSQEIEIPKQEYKDLFQPRLRNLNLYLDNRGIIYIYMPGNSDGAGGYMVVWMIKKHRYLKRYVSRY